MAEQSQTILLLSTAFCFAFWIESMKPKNVWNGKGWGLQHSSKAGRADVRGGPELPGPAKDWWGSTKVRVWMWTLSSSKTNSVISLLQTASEKCNPTEKCHLILSSSSMLRAPSCSQRRKWHRATVLSMTTLSANKRILGNPCHHPGGPMIYSALFEAALISVIQNTWPLSDT